MTIFEKLTVVRKSNINVCGEIVVQAPTTLMEIKNEDMKMECWIQSWTAAPSLHLTKKKFFSCQLVVFPNTVTFIK